MTHPTYIPDPELDLVLERSLDVPVDLVWEAWTTPQHLKQWFVPRPWTITECEIDLRPGGRFRTVMRSPEGEEFGGDGCILEIVEGRRLVWTDTLGPGYRPSAEPFFTAVVSMEPDGSGTRYRAIAIHGNPETKARQPHFGMCSSEPSRSPSASGVLSTRTTITMCSLSTE